MTGRPPATPRAPTASPRPPPRRGPRTPAARQLKEEEEERQIELADLLLAKSSTAAAAKDKRRELTDAEGAVRAAKEYFGGRQGDAADGDRELEASREIVLGVLESWGHLKKQPRKRVIDRSAAQAAALP